ncbi:Protein of unknown function DUF2497 [Rhabdaerophilaceae bacterium]
MATNAAIQSGHQAAEPSMEEILASIRKIIADDTLGTKKDETPAHIPAPAPMAAERDEDPDSDVLDLAQVAVVNPPKTAALDDALMIGEDEEQLGVDVDFSDMAQPVLVQVAPPSQAMPAMAKPAPQPPAAPLRSVSAMEDHIVSRETGGLVASAFASLARNAAMPAPGRSIEDVVAELLRPMLRDWMDSNLPAIVERLVKVEIERVARGG